LTSLIAVASSGTGMLYTPATAVRRGSRALRSAAAFGCTLGIFSRDAGRDDWARRRAHTSALFIDAEMAGRRSSFVYGLVVVAQARRAIDRRARGPSRRVNRDRAPDQHPQSKTIDLPSYLPAAVHCPYEAHPLARLLLASATAS
jgi:hypothetical protein